MSHQHHTFLSGDSIDPDRERNASGKGCNLPKGWHQLD